MSKNGKRSNTLSALTRRNRKTAKMINEYLIENENLLTQDQTTRLEGYSKYISRCSHFSLYKKNLLDQKITLIASSRCTNKACFVCNWINKRTIRRKYMNFFKDNQQLIQVVKDNQSKTITNSQLIKYQKKGFTEVNKTSYDIMHLTLTVPHFAEHGFNGNYYYFQELITKFNLLRKYPDISNKIYGGEFGVETTKNANGLHIHIHSLLFVKPAIQNRNTLHREILHHWNNLTVNNYSQRSSFTDFQIEQIIKGNKLLTKDFIVKNLNPQGTTMITLENIYAKTDRGKERITDWNDSRMIKSVMEALSYHYEPKMFLHDDNTINIELLAELLPHVYKQRLYSKIGCLYGEKSLNLSENETDIVEEFDEVIELVNEETGELVENTAFEYFVTDPAYLYTAPDDDYNITESHISKKYRTNINASGTRQALDFMAQMVKSSFKSKTLN